MPPNKRWGKLRFIRHCISRKAKAIGFYYEELPGNASSGPPLPVPLSTSYSPAPPVSPDGDDRTSAVRIIIFSLSLDDQTLKLQEFMPFPVWCLRKCQALKKSIEPCKAKCMKSDTRKDMWRRHACMHHSFMVQSPRSLMFCFFTSACYSRSSSKA